MMVIQRLAVAGEHVQDVVGQRRDVLIWEYGVVTGHVAAVHVREDGSADLVVEFEAPQPEVVPDVCERTQSCAHDSMCPFADSCARHW